MLRVLPYNASCLSHPIHFSSLFFHDFSCKPLLVLIACFFRHSQNCLFALYRTTIISPYFLLWVSMANTNHDGWGAAANSENGHEEIVQGWGCVGENDNRKGKVTQWEHAGHLDNFIPVGNNNSAQKGKGVCSSSSRERANNGPNGWKGKRDFGNGNGGGGGWKGKRDFGNGNGGDGGGWKRKRDFGNGNGGGGGGGWKRKMDSGNGNGGGGWKEKRAASNEIGGGWNAKRAASNEIGGGWNAKRASSNGGSQVSSGGNRVGKVQTLDNNFHGLNGHRVSLHFPVHSPHLQKILRDDFSLTSPRHEFRGQVNDPRPAASRQINGPPPLQVNEPRPATSRQINGPPPLQVNGPPPCQVNGPPLPRTPPSPPPANAVQVYQAPVQDRIVGRKVRVTHTPEGNWVMEVEEFR